MGDRAQRAEPTKGGMWSAGATQFQVQRQFATGQRDARTTLPTAVKVQCANVWTTLYVVSLNAQRELSRPRRKTWRDRSERDGNSMLARPLSTR